MSSAKNAEVRGWDKGASGIMNNEDGESFWMPKPMNGYVTLKYAPSTFPLNTYANGFQVLPPGGEIPMQSHRAADKFWYVMHGEGVATVDGVEHRVEAGSFVAGGRNVALGLRNDRQHDLKLFFTVWPPGLEEAYANIGRPRVPGSEPPASFDAPNNWRQLMWPARWADDKPAKAAGLKKGGTLVLGPNESDCFWQPPPGGYIFVKLSTKNYPSNIMFCGGQVLPPGGFIPPHAHTANEEVLLVVKGSGYAVVDEQQHPIGPGSLAFVDRWVRHSFVNTGSEDMVLFVTFSPPGLEKLLTQMGPHCKPGDKAPDISTFPPMENLIPLLRGSTLCLPDVALAQEKITVPPGLTGIIDYGA